MKGKEKEKKKSKRRRQPKQRERKILRKFTRHSRDFVQLLVQRYVRQPVQMRAVHLAGTPRLPQECRLNYTLVLCQMYLTLSPKIFQPRLSHARNLASFPVVMIVHGTVVSRKSLCNKLPMKLQRWHHRRRLEHHRVFIKTKLQSLQPVQARAPVGAILHALWPAAPLLLVSR